MWKNRYLAFISLLIAGICVRWQSIVAFSCSIVSVTGRLFESIITSFDAREPAFELLIAVLAMKGRRYDAVLNGLLKALDGEVSDLVAWRVYKQAQLIGPLLPYLGTMPLHNSLFLPHRMGDSFFASRLPFAQNGPAIAQFLLANYREAAASFSAPGSDIEAKIQKFCLGFYPETPTDMFAPLSHFPCDLRRAFFALQGTNPEDALPILSSVERANIAEFRLRPHSIYERQRFLTIQKSVDIMRSVATDTPYVVSDLVEYYESFCTIPVFRDLIENLRISVLRSYRWHIPTISPEEAPILLPEDFRRLFRHISGITSRGLIAVTFSDVAAAAREIDSGAKSNFWEHKWASLCFSLFVLSPSSELFSAAIVPYCHLMKNLDQYPVFLKYEASGRIVTLLRLGREIGTAACVKALSSIARLPGNPLQLWARQLHELACYSQLSSALKPLLREVSCVLALYAVSGLGVNDFILRAGADHCRTELSTLSALEQLFDFLFSDDFRVLQEQDSVKTLLRDFRDCGNLLELRKRGPNATLTSVLRTLSPATLATLSESRNAEATDEFVDLLLPASVPHARLQRKFDRLWGAVNRGLHFPVPGRSPSSQVAYFIALRGNISRLSADSYVVEFVTTQQGRCPYTISKSGQFRANSFAVAVQAMKTILYYSYASQVRAIRFCSLLDFRIGPRFVMSAISRDVFTLGHFFALDPRDPLVLKKEVCAMCTSEGYARMRLNLARNIGAAGLLKTVFRAEYPSLEGFWFSPLTGETPFHCGDFGIGEGETAFANFRASPSVANVMGALMKGEMMLAIAATAQALVQQLETVRSVLEVGIGDEGGREAWVSGVLMQARDRIEEVMFRYAPPLATEAVKEESEVWFADLERLIDKAMNAEIQPPECVPWF
jgi:hypothetical protein